MDSIIFDLDGTLWDSRETVVVAWNKVLRNRNIHKELTIEDLKKVMGLQMDEVAARLLPDVEEDERTRILEECTDIENDYIIQQGGKLYEDVEATIKELSQRYKLFIVSNCQEGYIEAFYEYHKLDKYFLDFENPGRTGLSKGENIELVIERNQLKSPVYVGDTDGDMKAARLASVPFVYARYGFGGVEEYDYVIDKFTELLDLK